MSLKTYSLLLGMGGILSMSFLVGCQSNTMKKQAQLPQPIYRSTSSEGNCSATTAASTPLIKFDYTRGEIPRYCDQVLQELDTKLKAIVEIPAAQRTFTNTYLAYESANTDFYAQYLQLAFPSSVSPNEDIRKESGECQEKVGKFMAEISSRKPLYLALKDVQAPGAIEKKMHEDTMRGFKHAGMQLSDEKIQKIRELNEKLSELENKFEQNLTNNNDSMTFTKEELAGVPESTLQRFQKTADGKYIVTTKAPDYIALADNATSSATRRKNFLAYQNRAAEDNTKLFHEILSVRREIASTLGYPSWAAIRLEEKMAKRVDTVQNFLRDLRQKLTPAQKADQRRLLDFKKKNIDPQSRVLDPWDSGYIVNQIKKSDYQVDTERIQEYFPADHVVEGMFKVYSQLLGIEISKIEGAPVWHPTAALYQIRNKGSCAPLAHFYMDNLPRPGKRGGAAAFPLIAGRKVANGYIAPVSAVVANFNPPTGNKPSLLSHDQVETLFHEFGHIMHQTLTKAPYGSISGTSVPWDFVEAPSQMLEHWTWDEKILQDLSGHYLDLSKKIPSDLVKKMMAAKDFNQANFYMRQLLLATYDMTLHTSKQPVDIHSTYRTLAKDMIDMDIPVETHFGSTFSHIASGGYHAGYYGYLWSEVFADDMHSRFESAPQKLMDANMGKRYREIILESGSTSEPQVLLRRFLGREPNNNAFMQKFKR